MRTERERLEEIREREAQKDDIPFPEPAILALQRTAGNQAVTRALARAPDLTVKDHATPAYERVSAWFLELADQTRQTESGTPVMSVPELVFAAGQLTYDDNGTTTKVSDRLKPSAIEDLLRRTAKEQGIVLTDHRDPADPRGIAAEAAAVMGNLGRIPTEMTFGGTDENITISLAGKVEANVGGLHLEGESLPQGGAKGGASIKGDVGTVEAHGSPEGAGASVTTKGGTKVGVDIGTKGVKAEVRAGDLITIKGSVMPEGDGRVSWSAQITIGTLGQVITAEDVAKVMSAAQDTFAASGAALLRNHGPDGITANGPLLKKAVTDVAEKAKKSAAQAKSGVSVTVGVKGDKDGGYSGQVTLTWVF